MTEETEHALEFVFAGVLFCMAIVGLMRLHGAFMHQIHTIGTVPERLILFEETGGDEWKH